MFFLLLIVIEMIGLILLGRVFGLFLSLLWIIITFFIGKSILKNLVKKDLSEMMKGMAQNKTTSEHYLTYAAVALMLPGIVSDVLGFILLIYGYFLKFTKGDGRKKTKSSGPVKSEDGIIDLSKKDFKERD